MKQTYFHYQHPHSFLYILFPDGKGYTNQSWWWMISTNWSIYAFIGNFNVSFEYVHVNRFFPTDAAILFVAADWIFVFVCFLVIIYNTIQRSYKLLFFRKTHIRKSTSSRKARDNISKQPWLWIFTECHNVLDGSNKILVCDLYHTVWSHGEECHMIAGWISALRYKKQLCQCCSFISEMHANCKVAWPKCWHVCASKSHKFLQQSHTCENMTTAVCL